MKVLIQNPQSLLYLESLGQWCSDLNDAFDFGNSDHAVQFCATHGIAPVHVVLQWSGMPYSIAIPVAAAQQQREAEKATRLRKHL
jgi:hypothetical protein